MKLVVGLGNPGPEYDRTRHNVGFEVVDRLARRHGDPANSVARNKFSALVVDAVVGDEKVMLMKPLTFMNLSGKAVAEAVRFYKMSPADDLMVIVDDTAVTCGSIRIKPGGGAGDKTHTQWGVSARRWIKAKSETTTQQPYIH